MNKTATPTTVNSQRREDFALTQVPATFKRPGIGSLFGVILAIPSALVFFSVGGALEQAYGTVALLTGLAVAAVIIGYAGWILTSFACKSGLDSDLMSIVAGFGRVGSGLTSAIYSCNFLVLFALEDGIVASAVKARWPHVPSSILFIGVGVTVLILSWRGVWSISGAMKVTLPFFLVLFVIACMHAGQRSPHTSFWSYTGSTSLNATAWLSVLAALLAFIVNATVAADVGRFLKPERRKTGAFLFGVVLQMASFGGATLLGAWLAHQLGGNTNPGAYLVTLLGGWGVITVLLSQVRINMINAYSGSLSLSNFGARGLRIRPGRHVWMMVLVVGATLLAMTNIYEHILGVLTFEAVFVMAWVSTLVSYILTYDLEKEDTAVENLADAPIINVVGVGTVLFTLAVATPLAFGAAGELGKALAPLSAIVLAPVGVVVLRRLSRTSRVLAPFSA